MTFRDFVIPAKVEKGSLKVWKRNFIYFKKTILVSLFWIVFEPLMYLAAFGYGLGAFIDTIQGRPFLEFFFPGLLCSTAMMVPFFEGTYANYSKLTHQKTYTAILLTPIGTEEIVYGELLWCASKGFIGVLGVVTVSLFFGLIDSWMIFPALLTLFLMSWLFSCLAMVVTSYARNYDSFIYSTSGFIIPMSLIAGTYFPIDHMPTALQILAYTLPLTHGVSLVRGLLQESLNWTHGLNLAYLLIASWVFMNFAMKRISKKLIY